MLRGTRSLLPSSPRAVVTQRASISSLSKLKLRAVTSATTSRPTFTRALIPHNIPPIQKARYVSKSPSGLQHGRDPEEEKEIGQQKLEANPEVVTTESSVRHLCEPDSRKGEKPIKHGIKDDLETVKDTFALSSVPREPYFLGLAGTLPYLATSVSTVYLSWDLNTEWPSTSNLVNNTLISHDTAHQLLSVIEPIQLGYGAVIISFLGAIHWGLEYAEKTPNPERTRFRYGLGVLASVVAWPTLLMPMDFALTAQFAAFVMLYFADARATVRAWAPSWYGAYRFVLTAVVGAAIVISLIGRMKVGDAKPRLTGLSEKLHDRRGGEQDYTKKWEELENRDKEKMRKEKEAEEERKKKAKENAQKEKEKEESDEGKEKNEKKTENKAEEKNSEQQEGKDEDDKDKGSEEGEKGAEEKSDEK
ncbi:hypothetical protein F4677DRAFT_434634 [Hypoxylon crocopeplum]|nr:hypothetical protein F4677DRAFT_434634 [Hypoxylon crocopeplum]